MSNSDLSRRSLIWGAGFAAGLGAPLAAKADDLTAASATPVRHYSLQHNLERLVDLRFGMFNHFNMGTFTNEEWATPGLDPKTFAPSNVDCDQWAAAAKAAGMTFGVLTTKHHDGFCLWPSKYNNYNVANSSYPHDIVRKYVNAFRKAGLKVGLYMSVWDRTYPVQVGDSVQAIWPFDITFVVNQITELLTNYGTIDIWVNDGYAWQMGQQAVPYQQVRDTVKRLQPNAVMIDHGAISQPFLGDAIYFEEPLGVTSPPNNTYASVQGTTITSAGWFWHPQDPTTPPMSETDIVNHLTYLEPNYTSFLLNCPPNQSGVLDDNIVAVLASVGQAWSPNPNRPALPVQQGRVQWPVTPVNAYATGWNPGEGPLRAIDARSDLNFETCWSTWPGTGTLTLPQAITVDLGGVFEGISALEYLPKQWNRQAGSAGDITSYTIATSTDGVNFTTVASGSWAADQTTKLATWPTVTARFVRLQANAGDGNYSNVSELRIGGFKNRPTLQPAATFPTAATKFTIVNVNSSLALDLQNGATAGGTALVQNTPNGSTSQQWTFEREISGYFRIRNVATSMVIQVANWSQSDGGYLQIWNSVNSPQQNWAVTPFAVPGTPSGGFVIVNRLTGLAMNVDGASTSAGGTISQWDLNNVSQEIWQIVPV